jgi:ketosteroid isomerase-like protein
MPPAFATPQDAEDAYYDAIDECDLTAMRGVWADAPEIACLLPMQPLLRGDEVLQGWQQALDPRFGVEVTVRHLGWVEGGELAIHLVEELVTLKGQGGRAQPPIYATNVYRRGADGWRMVLHLNAPAPPPAGLLPPIPSLDEMR